MALTVFLTLCCTLTRLSLHPCSAALQSLKSGDWNSHAGILQLPPKNLKLRCQKSQQESRHLCLPTHPLQKCSQKKAHSKDGIPAVFSPLWRACQVLKRYWHYPTFHSLLASLLLFLTLRPQQKLYHNAFVRIMVYLFTYFIGYSL